MLEGHFGTDLEGICTQSCINENDANYVAFLVIDYIRLVHKLDFAVSALR